MMMIISVSVNIIILGRQKVFDYSLKLFASIIFFKGINYEGVYRKLISGGVF